MCSISIQDRAYPLSAQKALRSSKNSRSSKRISIISSSMLGIGSERVGLTITATTSNRHNSPEGTLWRCEAQSTTVSMNLIATCIKAVYFVEQGLKVSAYELNLKREVRETAVLTPYLKPNYGYSILVTER